MPDHREDPALQGADLLSTPAVLVARLMERDGRETIRPEPETEDSLLGVREGREEVQDSAPGGSVGHARTVPNGWDTEVIPTALLS